MPDVTLEFLGKQIDRLIGDVGSMREDMTVMMAILQRLDHRVGALEASMSSIGSQLIDMHAYNRRTEARVHKLEEKTL